MKSNSHRNVQKKIVKAVGVTTAIAVLVPAVSMGEGVPKAKAAATEGTATKSESVYVNVDATGKTEKETVSDWLHDSTSGAVVVDRSDLENIANVKGNEKPQISGNTVTWNLSGSDLYYQGKTEKQTPVSMTLAYYLDGKPVSPSDLAGKSGKFELKITFQNHDGHLVSIGGQNRTVYTPFACVAAFNLPAKYFSNVTTNFGKVVSDGSNQAVSFIGFPGLKESFGMLDLSSLNLPDELDVTADVKDFTLGPVMMIATPVPDMDSLKNTSNLSDLSGKLTQLINAGLELKDATGTLNAGEQAFAGGVGQLFEGITTAGSSFDQIVAGADTLNGSVNGSGNGISQLISGTQSVASGAGQVSGGLGELLGLFQTTPSGNTTLKDGLDGVTGGAEQLDNGLGQLATQLGQINLSSFSTQSAALQKGVGDYTGMVPQVVYNMVKSDQQTMQQAIQGALTQALSNSLKQQGYTDAQIQAAVAGQAGTLSQEASGAAQAAVASEIAQMKSGADTALQAFASGGFQDTTKLQTAVGYMNLYDILNASANTSSESQFESVMNSALTVTPSSLLYTYDVSGFPTAVQSAVKQAMASNVVSGGTYLKSSVQSGMSSLSTQLAQFPQLIQGVGQLKSGADKLLTGTQQLDAQTVAGGTLHDSVAALATGAQQLSTGAQTLASGASGLTSLQNGIGSLTNALGQFRTGLATIQSGSSTLNSSAKQLTDGTAALQNGMGQFWDQGLSPLQSLDTDKMSQALSVKDEMIQFADQYTSFTGTGDGISSSVKFIVKTDEIKPAVQSTAGTAGTAAKSRSVWQKIANWFQNLFRAN